MLDIQGWTFRDHFFKTKETFQDTEWPQKADTLLFYEGECCVPNRQNLFPSHSSSTRSLYCCGNSSLHGSREEKGKAAAQNSLIRPAMIHGVITGQAGRCLQNGGPAERGLHGPRLQWRIKRTFITFSRRERALVPPANSRKGSQTWGNSARQFINTVLESDP